MDGGHGWGEYLREKGPWFSETTYNSEREWTHSTVFTLWSCPPTFLSDPPGIALQLSEVSLHHVRMVVC